MNPLPCARCGLILMVEPALEGKKVACPQCKHVTAVPRPRSATDKTMQTRVSRPSPVGVAAAQPAFALQDEPSSITEHAEDSKELISFLGPAQAPGEIGRLGQYRI